MSMFLTVVGFVAAACLTIALLLGQQVLAIEAQGWMLVLSRHLVERAVRRLPESHRLRYAEEWLAELEVLRSRPISALGYSVLVLTRARRTGSELWAGAPDPSSSSPLTMELAPLIAIGDVWDALDAAGVHPEGVGMGSAYFRFHDGRLLKFPNRGFFDHGIASDDLLAAFACWGACPRASGKYPMPPDVDEQARQPRKPMFVEGR